MKIYRLVTAMMISMAFAPAVVEAQTVVPAGVAMDLMFDPVRNPKIVIKRQGAIQRQSFKGLLESSKKDLQIAFVVDGTNSMSKDIASVLANLSNVVDDIRRQKGAGSKISFSVVVYRDIDSPTGVVEFPAGQKFSTDPVAFHEVVKGIKTATGNPDFEEKVDVGLQEAMTRLNWNQAPNVSRWILLFGDAPPYQDNFVGKNLYQGKQRKRTVSTADLLALAGKKKITVNCMLCSTGFIGLDDKNAALAQQIYNAKKPATEQFMKALTEGTGGAFWNLGDPQVRQEIARHAEKSRATYISFDRITPADVEKFKAQNNGGVITIGILPHQPLAEINFQADAGSRLVSLTLENKFSQLPGFRVRSASEMEQSFKQLPADASLAGKMKALALDTSADIVLWGTREENGGQIALTTRAYRKRDGKEVASYFEQFNKSEDEQAVLSEAVERLTEKLATHLTNDRQKKTAQSASDLKVVHFKVAKDLRALRAIYSGSDALRASLEYEKGSVESVQGLETAVGHLNAAAKLESTNPIVYSLLASAYFNLASDNKEMHKKHIDAISKAYSLLENAPNETFRTEIEADYAFFVQQDVQRAIDGYEALSNLSKTPLRANLRAQWMLAAIRSGDWGVDAKYVDRAAVRKHITTILATHGDSPEAAYFKRVFNYDKKRGTESPYYPKTNAKFAMSGK